MGRLDFSYASMLADVYSARQLELSQICIKGKTVLNSHFQLILTYANTTAFLLSAYLTEMHGHSKNMCNGQRHIVQYRKCLSGTCHAHMGPILPCTDQPYGLFNTAQATHIMHQQIHAQQPVCELTECSIHAQ